MLDVEISLRYESSVDTFLLFKLWDKYVRSLGDTSQVVKAVWVDRGAAYGGRGDGR